MNARSGALGSIAGVAVWLALSSVNTARAQVRSTPAPSSTAKSLKHRLGFDVAEALLRSQDAEDRERGFERLGSVGNAQALDLLLKSFDPGGAARSAKDRLIAVRALAPHAKVPAVRELLVRVMVGVGSNPERPEAIDRLIERAAALALAASGDDAALAALGKALRQPGHVAETARDALSAFPPRTLAALVESRSAPTKTLVALLSELGDPRAIEPLREIVRSAPVDVRADAAVALAKFRVGETVELARHWLAHERAPALGLASARILLEFHAPDSAAALARLLAEEPTRQAALELANSASVPELAPALILLARHASGEERSAIFSALGLTGTREALSFLGGALGTRGSASASAAALALALAPSSDAGAVLSSALGVAGTRRVAVRASIARKIALGRTPSGLNRALKQLSASRDPSDRAVLAEADAVLSPSSLTESLSRATADEARAIARAALVPEVAPALAARLAAEPSPALREALASCLAWPSAAELVPTDVLLALIEARGLAAPLAARALALRDSPTLRPKILSLLQSDDAIMRAHTALGLARSEEASALGVLERAYRFETDDAVRLALVHALAIRPEPAKKRALSLARLLDASRAVREAAALALASAEPARELSGNESAWLDLTFAPGAPRPARGAALVVAANGLALPAFADPDGVLLLPALPAGPFSLRLAAEPGTDDAPKSEAP